MEIYDVRIKKKEQTNKSLSSVELNSCTFYIYSLIVIIPTLSMATIIIRRFGHRSFTLSFPRLPRKQTRGDVNTCNVKFAALGVVLRGTYADLIRTRRQSAGAVIRTERS